MKAVIFDKELKFVDNYPRPEPLEKEALIRVFMAGICNTDLEIIKGYKGFKGVLGHEFVGEVVKVNGNNQNLIGKRVVGEINIGCGTCDYCLNGLKNHCHNRKVLGISGKDGALAEYITLAVENVHVVPDNISDEEAVFTEPLAAAFQVTEQIQINPDDNILIMGDGKLGLLIALALKSSHPHITLLGKHEKKLKIVEDQNVKSILVENLIVEKKYDIVIDATGSISGLKIALNLVKPRGTIILKTTVAESSELHLAPVVINEITVIGSRCGPFEPALDGLSKKRINVRPLITEIFLFDKAQEAFEKAREKDSLKVIIDFR